MYHHEYEQFVQDNASKTQMYNDIISDLTHEDNSNRYKVILAKNEDDRIEIWTNYLAKYIVQLVNQTITKIWEENWREETEDWIREKNGLKELQRYNNDIWFAKE